MYRAPAVGNKLCAKKDEERRDAIMRSRIREVRSSLDMTEPKVMKLDHLRTNMKRDQLLEDRYMEIDRSNRILLQKMSEIMRNAAPTSAAAQPPRKPPAVSLNRQLRKTELTRINQENQMMLKRIERAQPMYDHVKWEQNYRSSRVHLKNCCEYPVIVSEAKASSRNISTAPAKASRPTRPSSSPQVLTPTVERPTSSLHSRSLHTQTLHLNGKRFALEMTTDGRTLSLSAQDSDTLRTVELVVNESNHRSLFRECNGQYAQLAKRVVINGDRLEITPLSYN
jgi:Hemingway/CFA97